MERKPQSKITGFIRIGIVAAAILLQLALVFVLLGVLQERAVYFYSVIEVASIISVFSLAISKKDSAYTLAWILIIVLLPVFGYVLFLIWGRNDFSNPMHTRVNQSIEYGSHFVNEEKHVADRLHRKYPYKKQVYGHLERKGFNVYTNTACRYFPLGELQFQAMMEDMLAAKKSIFLCYFILNTGRLWDEIYEILVKKAAEGVEVRLMYDDIGSIFTAPDNIIADLESKNIKVVRFSPAHKFISRLLINFRNHQKMTLIDGNIGYTGGTNIADEYTNYYPKHGHWKDNAIRMEGEGVWGLTVIFLEMWDSQTGSPSVYDDYRPDAFYPSNAIDAADRPHLSSNSPANAESNLVAQEEDEDTSGFFIPFADGPNNNPDNPAEDAYRSMIATSCRYLYVTTPYLVIDETMRDLLCTAATAGVDVRIITPYVWDHWYVKYVSRANFKPLMEAGVKIYEYLPGFIHAKTIMADDEHCIIGSINMDYRSFHLHYENGVWMSDTPALDDIKQDLMETIDKSRLMTLDDLKGVAWPKRLLGNVLRLFEVLM